MDKDEIMPEHTVGPDGHDAPNGISCTLLLMEI